MVIFGGANAEVFIVTVAVSAHAAGHPAVKTSRGIVSSDRYPAFIGPTIPEARLAAVSGDGDRPRHPPAARPAVDPAVVGERPGCREGRLERLALGRARSTDRPARGVGVERAVVGRDRVAL